MNNFFFHLHRLPSPTIMYPKRQQQYYIMLTKKLSSEIVYLAVSLFLAKSHVVSRMLLGRASPKPQRGPYTISHTWQRTMEAYTLSGSKASIYQLFAVVYCIGRYQRLLHDLTLGCVGACPPTAIPEKITSKNMVALY
jgi:hypothetical protein